MLATDGLLEAERFCFQPSHLKLGKVHLIPPPLGAFLKGSSSVILKGTLKIDQKVKVHPRKHVGLHNIGEKTVMCVLSQSQNTSLPKYPTRDMG